MEWAFWDTSALVPLCVRQQATPLARQLVARHQMVVWWATPVEVRSAFSRLARMHELTAAEFMQAQARLERLRHGWREIQPSDPLRAHAESLLDRHQLRAGNSLQLAAACVWASPQLAGRPFISGDQQLLEAARRMGFRPLEV